MPFPGRLETMNECELIALVTSVACGLSKCCSQNDITIMAAVFSQLGDTLATVLTYRELNEQSEKEEGPGDQEPEEPNEPDDQNPRFPI